MKYKRISSFEELKTLLKGLEPLKDQLECFILTGLGRSSKTFIPQEDGAVVIIHEIDDHTVTINSVDKIATSKKAGNIMEAISKGAFYLYDYEQPDVDAEKKQELINETAQAIKEARGDVE
jgi:hypothetical protein